MPFPMLLRLAPVVIALASPSALHAADRDAAAILAEYKAIKAPQINARERDDPAKLAAYRAAGRDNLTRKAALIGELIRVAPDDPETAALAFNRWRTNLIDPATLAATKVEVAAILGKNEHPGLVVEAAYFETWLALGALHPNETFATMMPIVEKFTQRFPDDRRGATLLQQAASYLEDPAKKAELLAKIEKDYADAASVRSAVANRQQAERVGKPFELAFKDATTGSPVSIKQLKGKVIVVDFWATWCGPCIEDMPRMKQLYAEYHPKGVEFIGVSLDLPEADGGLTRLKDYIKTKEIPWPQYYQGNGWESKFSESMGINAIPALFLVDADGNLASVDARADLETLLPKYLDRARKPTSD